LNYKEGLMKFEKIAIEIGKLVEEKKHSIWKLIPKIRKNFKDSIS